ncbi:hypothetical protein H8356DRAFT_1358010 [Neocallimastix lanati (nom. inval.)]|nr:hypothetical protein H8356DRAFT_1358010 [Neocallimastix sp. JGI-2020a]
MESDELNALIKYYKNMEIPLKKEKRKRNEFPPPSGMLGYYVVENLKKVIPRFGNMIKLKDNIQTSYFNIFLRSELQPNGVYLINCQHNGRKNLILVDMLAFALDTPSPGTVFNEIKKYNILNEDDTVDLQNNLSFVTNPSNGNISYSTSFFNIIVKTNFSAIEATKRALEKSVVKITDNNDDNNIFSKTFSNSTLDINNYPSDVDYVRDRRLSFEVLNHAKMKVMSCQNKKIKFT